MGLRIHDFLSFYGAYNWEDKFIDYSSTGYILSFQGNSNSPEVYNGISFVEIVDPDSETFSAADVVFQFLSWNIRKILFDHSETSGEADPSRGNRLIAFPLMIKNEVAIEHSAFQIQHISSQGCKFIEYDSGTNIVTLKMNNQLNVNSYNDMGLVLSASSAGGSTIDGIDSSYSTDLISTISEWEATLVSFDGITLLVELDEVPSDPQLLSDINFVSPSTQSMYLIPLGHVSNTGVSEYNRTPSEVGVTSWTYYPEDSHTTPSSRGVCPKVYMDFTNVGEAYKYILVLERDKTFEYISNGFKLVPNIMS